MFMVLMMHTSFITFGFPTVEGTKNEPLFCGLQTLQYSVAIVAVNVFCDDIRLVLNKAKD